MTRIQAVGLLTSYLARIRHIKCDEERPACGKCRSTGRVCDGYETKDGDPVFFQNNNTPLFPMEIAIKALSMIPRSLVSIPGTDRERRSFAFFCYQTGQQLSTALDIARTHQLILQASHCDEAVRSAVIALGSIGERLSINSLLTLDNEQANACHEFAHTQYYAALRRLRERISKDPDGSVDVAIILCFLFTVFEFLQGNDAECLIHLRSGLDILRRQQGSQSTDLSTVSPDRDPLKREILRIFSTMDIHATVWLGLETFQAPMMIPLEDFINVSTSQDKFSSLDEASESLDHQMIATYHFRRLNHTYDSSESPDQISPEAYASRDRHILKLKKWLISLENLTNNLQADMSTETARRIAVLKMNHTITLIILTACLQPSSLQVYADHEPDFRHVVDLAKSIIRPPPPTTTTTTNGKDHPNLKLDHNIIATTNHSIVIDPTPMFSFAAGVIKPLYLTAIKCQKAKICREAITLLSTSPWREGAWDSAAMARIAERRVYGISGWKRDM